MLRQRIKCGNKWGVVTPESRSEQTGGNVRGCRCRAFKISDIEYERGQMRGRSREKGILNWGRGEQRRDTQQNTFEFIFLFKSSESATIAVEDRHCGDIHRTERVC